MKQNKFNLMIAIIVIISSCFVLYWTNIELDKKSFNWIGIIVCTTGFIFSVRLYKKTSKLNGVIFKINHTYETASSFFDLYSKLPLLENLSPTKRLEAETLFREKAQQLPFPTEDVSELFYSEHFLRITPYHSSLRKRAIEKLNTQKLLTLKNGAMPLDAKEEYTKRVMKAPKELTIGFTKLKSEEFGSPNFKTLDSCICNALESWLPIQTNWKYLGVLLTDCPNSKSKRLIQERINNLPH